MPTGSAPSATRSPSTHWASTPRPDTAPSQSRAEIVDLYSRVAPAYADKDPSYFALASNRLVQLANVRPGDAVLDLGTGRGAVLVVAAQQVGPTGRAVGIDIAPGMLESTRRVLDQLDLRHAHVLLMDATQLDLN